MKNPFKQSEIVFEPVEHKYQISTTGQKLISVSQLLHLYTVPFDPTGIILYKCAQKEGVSKEILKKRWEDKSKTACSYGSAVHAEIEYFIKNKRIRKSEHKKIVKNFKEKVYPEFSNQLFSEVLVYSTDLLIAGTSDLVEFNPETNEICIFDIKTNESLYKKSYNNFLFPLNKTPENKINFYSMQLSAYAFLLELKGFAVKPNFKIFWVNPANQEIEIIPIKYLKSDVEKIIQHYKNGYEFF